MDPSEANSVTSAAASRPLPEGLARPSAARYASPPSPCGQCVRETLPGISRTHRVNVHLKVVRMITGK